MDGSVFWSIGDVFAISPPLPPRLLPNVMAAFIDAAVVAAETVGAPCGPAAAAADARGPRRQR